MARITNVIAAIPRRGSGSRYVWFLPSEFLIPVSYLNSIIEYRVIWLLSSFRKFLYLEKDEDIGESGPGDEIRDGVLAGPALERAPRI